MHQSQLFDFVRLTAAHKQGRIRRFAFAGDASHWRQAGSFGKQAELFELAIEMRQAEVDPHQDGDAGGLWCGVVQAVSLKIRRKKRAETALFGELLSSDFRRTACAVRRVKVDSAARHDGRDGVLVDHLRHGVAQQHDVLIK